MTSRAAARHQHAITRAGGFCLPPSSPRDSYLTHPTHLPRALPPNAVPRLRCTPSTTTRRRPSAWISATRRARPRSCSAQPGQRPPRRCGQGGRCWERRRTGPPAAPLGRSCCAAWRAGVCRLLHVCLLVFGSSGEEDLFLPPLSPRRRLLLPPPPPPPGGGGGSALTPMTLRLCDF